MSALSIEQIEQNPGLPQWVGGMMEIGTGLGYVKQLKKEGPYTYPYIHLTDDDELKAIRLRKLFGGTKTGSKTKGSYEWKLTGERTAKLVIPALSYAPSRAHMISSIEEWFTSDKDTRQIIAEGMRAADRTPVKPKDYASLVNMPEFVAGVIDGRGIFHWDFPWGGLRLTIHSKNVALLTALSEKFDVTVLDGISEITGGVFHKIEIQRNQTLGEILDMTRDFRMLN